MKARVNRREFVRSALSAAGGALGVRCMGNRNASADEPRPARQARSGDRPNILFAISDDQSWIHTGIAGDPVVKTPAFDRVAREGVLFTRAFCSSPSCTPSRGAALTGQAFWRLKDGGNLWSALPSEFAVYPDLLEEGLKPHKVKEIWLWSIADNINHRSDITNTFNIKVQALRCHESQVGSHHFPDIEGRLRQWATDRAKGTEYELAEAFHREEIVW